MTSHLTTHLTSQLCLHLVQLPTSGFTKWVADARLRWLQLARRRGALTPLPRLPPFLPSLLKISRHTLPPTPDGDGDALSSSLYLLMPRLLCRRS